MKVQVNTDAHIDGHEALAAEVRATVEQALERFSEALTRVEVHLGDESGGTSGGPGGGSSGGKSGQEDKRCMLEARLQGRQPVAVTHHAATLEQAVHGAAQKLARLLDSTLGRLHEHRDNPGKREVVPPVPGAEPAHR
jgi:ribosome-associated translation inhibitor RaiA